jgi:hypothetical protein
MSAADACKQGQVWLRVDELLVGQAQALNFTLRGPCSSLPHDTSFDGSKEACKSDWDKSRLSGCHETIWLSDHMPAFTRSLSV